MNRTRLTVLTGMILAAAASRLIPHPPNFTPIGAIALFGGVQFADKRTALVVPLMSLFLGDLVIGMHALMPFVYGSFALMVCLGFWVRRRPSAGRTALAMVGGAVLFFVVTNFGVWARLETYPKNAMGLMECYIAGLPYFRNMLAGDLFYNAILFGGLWVAEYRFMGLRENGAGVMSET